MIGVDFMSVYESIIKGLNEAIDYEKGTGKARTTKCTVNPVPEFNAQEIKDVRISLGMTQVTFAEVMGVSTKTVEAWEAGTNKPIGSARRFLSVLKSDPSLLNKCNIISA
jgi:putative transcriptional regulator